MQNIFLLEKSPERPPAQDFAFLRAAGIRHIEKLAHELWTDYNIHDPGITMLEMLCYAITDLGVRTALPVADILADAAGQTEPAHRPLFSARQILTINPVTLNDYRKLLIDVPGVKNAWVEPLASVPPPIFVDCLQSRLSLLVDPLREEDFRPLQVQGYYGVRLELAEDSEFGDLNLPVYPFTIPAGPGGDSFEIHLVLPYWDEILSEKIDPQHLRLGPLGPAELRRTYTGPLQIHDPDSGDTLDHPTLRYQVVSGVDRTDAATQRIREALAGESFRRTVWQRYLRTLQNAGEVAAAVWAKLHAHRNLCEDFFRIEGVRVDEIKLCAEVEVTAAADIETVQAEIYHRIGQFLAPPVRFYTIRELLDRGKRSEEIFNGPALDHGFIDEDELAAADFREVIHVSDLVQIIMDVPGVLAVKKILINNFREGQTGSTGEAWCLNIGPNRAARLSVQRSKLIFYKGVIPYLAREEEAAEKLRELHRRQRQQRLAPENYDLPMPSGQNRNIENYFSIQHDFPLTYGVGPEGLSRDVSESRKAQARQLKAYLMFYEQLLANYFAQLAHLGELFSLNPELKKTFFSQPLYPLPGMAQDGVPNVFNLLKGFVDYLAGTRGLDDPTLDLDRFASYKTEWESYAAAEATRWQTYRTAPDPLVEDQTRYETRKNRLLDHLMARFGEQFTDYVLLMYRLDNQKAPAELIEDKLQFLQDLPEISRNRGKAFNYKNEAGVWDTDNVSGWQQRVARLTGIADFRRRNLADPLAACFQIYEEVDTDGIAEYRFRMVDDAGNILLSSSVRYPDQAAARAEIAEVKKRLPYEKFYQRKTTTSGKFYFNLIDESGEVIARRIEYFPTAAARDAAIAALIKFVQEKSEGFHLIEHILLRPRLSAPCDPRPGRSDACLLNICIDDCDDCPGKVDPYSFRVTVVIPARVRRFENLDFRAFFEQTLRLEAPAHVHVKICWVDPAPLQVFEDAYRPWLIELAKPDPDPLALAEKQNALVAALENLRSVYPPATLHDCREDAGERPAVLNQSTLGTLYPEE